MPSLKAWVKRPSGLIKSGGEGVQALYRETTLFKVDNIYLLISKIDQNHCQIQCAWYILTCSLMGKAKPVLHQIYAATEPPIYPRNDCKNVLRYVDNTRELIQTPSFSL